MSLIKNCEIPKNVVKLKIGIYRYVEREFFFEGGRQMKYLVWIMAWVVTQRIMMFFEIIHPESLFSSILTAIVSVIAVLFVRNSKLILTVAMVLIVIWVVNTISYNPINAIVGGIMNAWLITIALEKKH